MAFFRERPGIAFGKNDPNKASFQRFSFDDLKASCPDEKRFVLAQRPLDVRFVGIGQRIRVLADNQMTLFETQKTLCLHAEGPDPHGFTRLEKRVPDVTARSGRNMNLETLLADKTDAHQQRGNVRDVGFPYSQVRKMLTCQVEVGQRLEYVPCLRAGNIHGCQMPRGVHQHDVHLE